MNYIKKILRVGKSILSKDFSYINNLYYLKILKEDKLEEKNILIEPQQGRTINGNMFYIDGFNDNTANVCICRWKNKKI